MLPQALEVMAAWGFRYRSHVVWAKDRAGTGYWFRNKHEILLVGVRGAIPAPAPGSQWPSLIEAPVGEHSAKPEAFLELIERYFPTLAKIELNRRGAPRPGWAAWGNEAAPAERAPDAAANGERDEDLGNAEAAAEFAAALDRLEIKLNDWQAAAERQEPGDETPAAPADCATDADANGASDGVAAAAEAGARPNILEIFRADSDAGGVID
jgi:hypothetical protein